MKREFDGLLYNDDRIFVLYLCKCTIHENEDSIVTTIHHSQAPEEFVWAVVTFRNSERYTAIKSNHFKSRKEAEEFICELEPRVPLISLNGNSPREPLPYEEFIMWKRRNGFKEYDYKLMFSPDSVSPKEVLCQKKR